MLTGVYIMKKLGGGWLTVGEKEMKAWGIKYNCIINGVKHLSRLYFINPYFFLWGRHSTLPLAALFVKGGKLSIFTLCTTARILKIGQDYL